MLLSRRQPFIMPRRFLLSLFALPLILFFAAVDGMSCRRCLRFISFTFMLLRRHIASYMPLLLRRCRRHCFSLPLMIFLRYYVIAAAPFDDAMLAMMLRGAFAVVNMIARCCFSPLIFMLIAARYYYAISPLLRDAAAARCR